ncbi:hypothetical protein Glove_208g202 [Diversispora epigaea]|uniref:Uncharacterized protein n=1 Tax=Diversispora epigaea TaxID=1348612 RepID=A0A397IQE1_9GLOM|nr:hypothetical protein Glove_208g202 [Diversispora epigaea]
MGGNSQSQTEHGRKNKNSSKGGNSQSQTEHNSPGNKGDDSQTEHGRKNNKNSSKGGNSQSQTEHNSPGNKRDDYSQFQTEHGRKNNSPGNKGDDYSDSERGKNNNNNVDMTCNSSEISKSTFSPISSNSQGNRTSGSPYSNTGDSERGREENRNRTYNNSSLTYPIYVESLDIPCYDLSIERGPWEFQQPDCRKVNCGLMLSNIKRNRTSGSPYSNTGDSERGREENRNRTYNNSSLTYPIYVESLDIPCYDLSIERGPWEFQQPDCRKVNCGLMLSNIKSNYSLGISVFSDNQNDSYRCTI